MGWRLGTIKPTAVRKWRRRLRTVTVERGIEWEKQAALHAPTGRRESAQQNHSRSVTLTKHSVQSESWRNWRHFVNKNGKNRGKTRKLQCKCPPPSFLYAKQWRTRFLWWSALWCSQGDPPQRRDMPVQQPHTASVTGAEQTGGDPETAPCSAQSDAGCVARQQCAPALTSGRKTSAKSHWGAKERDTGLCLRTPLRKHFIRGLLNTDLSPKPSWQDEIAAA